MTSRSEKIRALVQRAMTTKEATSWSVSDVDLEMRPLPTDQHPGLAAVMLVREAMQDYELPSQPKLTYQGMRRASGHGQHHIDDGVIMVQGEFQSQSGARHFIDIPIAVHRGYTVFPEVFIHQGETHVFAQSAFDAIVKRGEIYNKMQDRRNMFSPHVQPVTAPPMPQVGNGMWGVHATRRTDDAYMYMTREDVEEQDERYRGKPKPGEETPEEKAKRRRKMIQKEREQRQRTADHSPHGLDPAERVRADRPHPGKKVKLAEELAVGLRGGSIIRYPKGTSLTVIRDMMGDGTRYYCEFPDRRRAPVHYHDLVS